MNQKIILLAAVMCVGNVTLTAQVFPDEPRGRDSRSERLRFSEDQRARPPGIPQPSRNIQSSERCVEEHYSTGRREFAPQPGHPPMFREERVFQRAPMAPPPSVRGGGFGGSYEMRIERHPSGEYSERRFVPPPGGGGFGEGRGGFSMRAERPGFGPPTPPPAMRGPGPREFGPQGFQGQRERVERFSPPPVFRERGEAAPQPPAMRGGGPGERFEQRFETRRENRFDGPPVAAPRDRESFRPPVEREQRETREFREFESRGPREEMRWPGNAAPAPESRRPEMNRERPEGSGEVRREVREEYRERRPENPTAREPRRTEESQPQRQPAQREGARPQRPPGERDGDRPQPERRDQEPRSQERPERAPREENRQ